MSFDHIRRELLDLHGQVRPPAADSLAAFEEQFAVGLPNDVKAAYSVMDGSDYSTNPEKSWIRFWPIHEWKEATESLPPESCEEDRGRLFLVADYGMECVYYAIDLQRTSKTFGHIYALGATRISAVAPSFFEFVQLVLVGSDDLHSYS